MIEVVDHDPNWAKTFASLRDRYAAALVDVPVIAIEHVGSTSVPGLAAKPIIDIDVVVARQDVDAALAALEAIGFEPLGDFGIADRWALRPPLNLPRTNTYVVVDGSVALRNHLGVREVLRADAELREEYGDLKRAIAAEVGDIGEYVERKSVLLTKILRRASLTEAELADIEAANRAD